MSDSNAKPVNKVFAPLSEVVRLSIIHQSNTIASLVNFTTDDIAAAAHLIASLPDRARLHLCGVGKAGIIAQKIAATMASLSCPAFFLDPLNGVHGDIGQIMKGDVVLILSNSGETPEILQILPYITAKGAILTCITRSKSTTLSQQCSLTIEVGTIAECQPLSQAPTASTTAMLVVGDALAMAYGTATGVSSQQFAANHPAGDIGRSLKLISQVMRTGERHCIVRTTDPTRSVIHRITLTPGRPGAASVVDESGNLVGIFTDGNLRRLTDLGEPFLDKPIEVVMTKTPKTMGEWHLAQEAYALLATLAIDQLIIVDKGGVPVGMVDIQDLAAIFAPRYTL